MASGGGASGVRKSSGISDGPTLSQFTSEEQRLPKTEQAASVDVLDSPVKSAKKSQLTGSDIPTELQDLKSLTPEIRGKLDAKYKGVTEHLQKRLRSDLEQAKWKPPKPVGLFRKKPPLMVVELGAGAGLVSPPAFKALAEAVQVIQIESDLASHYVGEKWFADDKNVHRIHGDAEKLADVKDCQQSRAKKMPMLFVIRHQESFHAEAAQGQGWGQMIKNVSNFMKPGEYLFVTSYTPEEVEAFRALCKKETPSLVHQHESVSPSIYDKYCDVFVKKAK
jgi:hypothetical protein